LENKKHLKLSKHTEMSKKVIQVNEEDWHRLKIQSAIQKKPIAEVVADLVAKDDSPAQASGSNKENSDGDEQPS